MNKLFFIHSIFNVLIGIYNEKKNRHNTNKREKKLCAINDLIEYV